jgi:hypothetical protein
MDYETYTFFPPPRLEQAIPPDLIRDCEARGFIAQIKKNGTNNVITVSPNDPAATWHKDGPRLMRLSLAKASDRRGRTGAPTGAPKGLGEEEKRKGRRSNGQGLATSKAQRKSDNHASSLPRRPCLLANLPPPLIDPAPWLIAVPRVARVAVVIGRCCRCCDRSADNGAAHGPRDPASTNPMPSTMAIIATAAVPMARPSVETMRAMRRHQRRCKCRRSGGKRGT